MMLFQNLSFHVSEKIADFLWGSEIVKRPVRLAQELQKPWQKDNLSFRFIQSIYRLSPFLCKAKYIIF